MQSILLDNIKVCYNNTKHETFLTKKGLPIWCKHPNILNAWLCKPCSLKFAATCRIIKPKIKKLKRYYKNELSFRDRKFRLFWKHCEEENKQCYSCESYKSFNWKGRDRWYVNRSLISDLVIGWLCDTCFSRYKRRKYDTLEEAYKAISIKTTQNQTGRKRKTPVSQAHRIKVSLTLTGRKRPEFTGENNPAWRGGLTPLNNLIRGMGEMNRWKRLIFQRDEYTCQECGKIGGNLEAHHIKPFYEIIKEYNIKTTEDARNCKILWDLDNGICLCQECHYEITFS